MARLDYNGVKSLASKVYDALKAWVGALADLTTTEKGSIVDAINELVSGKQKKLTAGTNITITDDGTISASGGGSTDLHYYSEDTEDGSASIETNGRIALDGSGVDIDGGANGINITGSGGDVIISKDDACISLSDDGVDIDTADGGAVKVNGNEVITEADKATDDADGIMTKEDHASLSDLSLQVTKIKEEIGDVESILSTING